MSITSNALIASIDTGIASRPLTVMAFFRGSWCPFCKAYMKELGKEFQSNIKSKGGELVGITSQSEKGASDAKLKWNLDYQVVSDPSLELARRYGVAITPKDQTPLAQDPVEYPNGMSQAAVIAVDSSGKVIFRWAIEPSTMNLGGASDRPLPNEMWPAIEAGLASGVEQSVPLDGPLLNPDYLKEHYPESYTTFEAWVAASSSN